VKKIKKCLTLLPLSVILISYLLFKFISRPIPCCKLMKQHWDMVNHGIDYDNTPTHTEAQEKETKC